MSSGTLAAESASERLTAARARAQRAGWPNGRPGVPPTSEEQKDRFIAALEEGGAVVTDACQAGGFSSATAYEIRKRDPDFARRWAEALERGIEKLEKVVTQRAIDGSDVLAMFLLKARRPDVYRERREILHTGDARPISAGDLDQIRQVGLRPELAAAFDTLADALGQEVHEPALLEPGDEAGE